MLTTAEFEYLRDQYVRALGLRGVFKIGVISAGAVTICIVGLVLAGVQSDGASSALGYAVSAGILAYFLWIYSAPYRLVRNRVPTTPARSEKHYQSELAARVPNWRFVIPIVLVPILLWLGVSLVLDGSWWSPVPFILVGVMVYSWGKLAITKLSERERS